MRASAARHSARQAVKLKTTRRDPKERPKDRRDDRSPRLTYRRTSRALLFPDVGQFVAEGAAPQTTCAIRVDSGERVLTALAAICGWSNSEVAILAATEMAGIGLGTFSSAVIVGRINRRGLGYGELVLVMAAHLASAYGCGFAAYYAKEHWTFADENPPVGLILCADKGHALARYALEGLPSKVMAANYRMVLPDAELLQKELENTRRLIESRGTLLSKKRKK